MKRTILFTLLAAGAAAAAQAQTWSTTSQTYSSITPQAQSFVDTAPPKP